MAWRRRRSIERRPDANLGRNTGRRRTLRIYFIKPSQYDASGYVFSFRWGVIPNNTLTVLAGLNAAYARERPEVQMQTVLWDELVDGVISTSVMKAIHRRAFDDGVEAIIALAGVQTGQYPRARDLALQFRRLGLPVLMGGFHVSSDAPSRCFLESVGVTTAIGEAEGFWERLLDDYLANRLASSYGVSEGIRAATGLGRILVPPIENAPLPQIDTRYLRSFFNPSLSTVDTSRGCPFACSYCAVKNVMGRTMRVRNPARLLDWVRDAYDRHEIRSFFLVDDDFYRSPVCEEILIGLAALRRQGRDLTFMMQADVEAALFPAPDSIEAETDRHRQSRRFVERAAEAGCYAVFVGLESFDPVNLEATRKVQNQSRRDGRRTEEPTDARERVKERYRQAVENWHRAGVGFHAGYMIGLANDRRGCGRQAARDLTEIGVDITSFFPYTPLPGTEDYEAALSAGAIVEHDFNCWDCLHVVHRHPTLTPGEVYEEYCQAHRHFYTWRRLAWSIATGHDVPGLAAAARYGMWTQQIYYTYAYRRGWHPMMGGLWRRRDRSVRRRAVWNDEAAQQYLGDTVNRPPRSSVLSLPLPAPRNVKPLPPTAGVPTRGQAVRIAAARVRGENRRRAP